MSKDRLNNLLESDYELKIGQYLNEGFQLYKKNIGGFIGITFLIFVLYGASFTLSQENEIVGLFASLAFNICLYLIMAGYIIVVKKVRNNEPYEFRDFFAGFKGDIAGQVIAITLISSMIIALGMVLCLLPGIYLAIAYTFGIYIMLFFKIDFWESLEYSRKIVSKKWFSFFGFLLLLGLLNILGLIFLGIGLFVTMPWAMCALYLAFEDVFKPGLDSFETKIDSFGTQQRDINTEADERRS